MRTPDKDAQGNRLNLSQLDRLFGVKVALAAGGTIGCLNFGLFPYSRLAKTSLAERPGARTIVSILSGARVFAMTAAYININDFVTHSLADQSYSTEHPAVTRAFVGLGTGAVAAGLGRAVTAGIKGSFPIMVVGGMGGLALESIEYQWEARKASQREPSQDNFLGSLSKSRWIPLQNIPDEEYGSRLREKLAIVEHEIETVDREIQAARQNSK